MEWHLETGKWRKFIEASVELKRVKTLKFLQESMTRHLVKSAELWTR